MDVAQVEDIWLFVRIAISSVRIEISCTLGRFTLGRLVH